MKEISNQAQLNDSVAAPLDKNDSAMSNVAADTWSGRTLSSDKKVVKADDENVKCLVITDLYGNKTKGGCVPSQDFLPGKPSPLDTPATPPVKPEIPADGGPKYPIKEPIKDIVKDPIKDIVKDPIKDTIKDPVKVPSLDGGIKTPMKPSIVDSIEFGETFVKPVPKPGKVIQPNNSQNNTFEK